MTFSDFKAPSSPLFKKLNILKLPDIVKLNNICFVIDFLNGRLPVCFKNFFLLASEKHKYNTKFSANSSLWLPTKNTTKYGLKSMKIICIKQWNNLIKETELNPQESNSMIRDKLTKHLIDKY